MKKNLLCFLSLLLLSSGASIAQNRTLGVGVTSPNSNAALHVESPTNNQGFIMPRLTTAQRTAMAALPLGTSDAGIMVYDSDLKGIYIWDGANWAAAAKLSFPVNETITNSTPNSSIFRLVNNGSATGNFGVAAFENTNPNSGFSPLYVSTNSTTNGAIDVVLNNSSNTNDAIGITSNGAGTALRATSTGTGENAWFEVNNPSSSGSPVVAQTNGIGLAGLFTVANKPNGGTALMGTTNSDLGGALAPAGVYGLATGVGSVGGAFRIDAPGNGYSALYSETNGQGNVAYFKNINAVNPSPALFVESNGAGSAITGYHTNNGVALEIFNGGLRYNVQTVPSAGPIPQRKAIYDITVTGTFNLGWTGTSGDVIYVFNSAISSITFEGQTVNPGVLSQFIYIAGAWRTN